MFKKLILSSTLFFVVNFGYAQLFSKGFSAGVNIGVTQPFTDTHGSDLTSNFGIGVQYHLTPYTFISTDLVKSSLERKYIDRNNRKYRNSFVDFSLTANVSLGQLISSFAGKKLFLNNFYAGAGLGFINSNVTIPSAETTDMYGGKRYKGLDLIIPINVGYDFKLAKKGKILGNLNYQVDFTASDALDGYNIPYSKSNDMYHKATIGIKYLFGKPGGTTDATTCYY